MIRLAALVALLAVTLAPAAVRGFPQWSPRAIAGHARVPGATPPTITVRGTTQLELEKIERVRGGVMLTVRLVDGELGEGIPDRPVTLTIGQDGLEVFRADRTTSRAGSAQIFVPHQEGEYELSLGFAGDPLYVATSPTSTRVDLRKEAIGLTLSVPPRMDVGSRPLPVTVLARQNGPIPELLVEFSIRREGKVIIRRHGTTDQEGQVRLELPASELGGAGELMVEAISRATAEYNSARASQRVFLVSETTTTLHFARTSGRQDTRLSAQGKVTDSGGPVAKGTVRLLALGRVLATVTTDGNGRFSALVSLRHLPLGEVAVTAELVPASPWRRPSRSAPVVLVVEPPKPIPMSYFLTPALLTLAFIGVLLMARRRPWQRLKARWQALKNRKVPDGGGIALGRRRSMGGLFGADLFGIRGTVLDAHLGQPLAGAAIYVRARSREMDDHLTRAGEDGTFSLTGVPAGSWEILVSHPGYLPQSLPVSLPHRGELHGLLVRLQSVRQRVMDIYTDVVAPRLPDPALVRYWTPAEAATHLRRRSPPGPAAVEALSDLAAEVYYGSETPPTQRVAEAQSLASRAGESEEPISTPPPAEPE